jgi:outer membrane protein assembly factor BamB
MWPLSGTGLRFRRYRFSRSRFALLSFRLAFTLQATDWPQFLGPARDGSTADPIGDSWPSDGAPTVWEARVGEGFSSPVVAEGTAFLFHRRGDKEQVGAWAAATGVERWTASFPTDYSDDQGSGDGPKSTPAVAGGRLFALSPSGVLRALSIRDGARLWEVDLVRRFEAVRGFFGFATSPLVVGDRVVVQVGGPGASTVAFAAADGRVLWKSGSDEAGYGSPVPWVREGRTRVLAFNRSGAVAHDLEDGREVFRFPWRSRMHASVNAAAPRVDSTGLFLTASYGTGAAWIRPDGASGSVVWSGDDILSAHFATPVEWEGFLYGFHGRHESGPSFRCVDRATGKVRWSVEDVGSGSVVRVGGQLLVLSESGEMRVFVANPERAVERTRFQACGTGARMVPAVSEGLLWVRDRSRLTCRRLPVPTAKP